MKIALRDVEAFLAPISNAESARLTRFALEYIAEQVATKLRCRSWGAVTLELVFRQGDLVEVETNDKTRVRPDVLVDPMTDDVHESVASEYVSKGNGEATPSICSSFGEGSRKGLTGIDQ